MPKQSIRALALGAASVALATQAAAVAETFETDEANIHVESVADGDSHPWDSAWLPSGSGLGTEGGGGLRDVTQGGKLSEPLAGVRVVDARGQGGLLDVALDPNFSENRRGHLSCAE